MWRVAVHMPSLFMLPRAAGTLEAAWCAPALQPRLHGGDPERGIRGGGARTKQQALRGERQSGGADCGLLLHASAAPPGCSRSE